jgi:alkylation response protein AidB-like acyl-CoA dehydrogenase
MNFDLTEDQKMILGSVAAFVKKEVPVERARRMRDDPLGFSPATWKEMGELGWLGIAYPTEVGGFGGSFVDATLVLGELGTTLSGEPYVPSAVLAGRALLEAGTREQRDRWLAPMIAGEHTLAVGYAEHGSRYELARIRTRAERASGGWRLRGEKIFVLNGHAADQILVSARTFGAEADARGVSLLVLEADEPGLERQTIQTIDGRKAAILRFDCTLAADRLLGAEGEALPLLEKIVDHGAAAACAEGHGVMRTALHMTTAYLQTREQFGVKIGSFQALQHRAVDMFVECELLKSAAILAALKADAEPWERQRAVSIAKVQLAMSGRFVTQQAIQLHGGIGITDEHDIGLFFKRMLALHASFGDEEHHLARYASLPSFTDGITAAA